jgi:hypothetical protein
LRLSQREAERSIGYVVFVLPILGGGRLCREKERKNERKSQISQREYS